MAANIKLTVNGKQHDVTTDPSRSLLDVLREDLQLTGAKYGCGEGECGACTVLIDGKRAFSCTTAVSKAEGKSVITIEGLSQGDRLHPVQEAFVAENAYQCGYCIPGHILNTVALLSENPKPSEEQVLRWANRNLCRCCAYPNILSAVRRAAGLNEKTANGEGR
jgi:aerobic-type carbon monoxide dehydrogenase small subunit (CoxS/CutS family)